MSFVIFAKWNAFANLKTERELKKTFVYFALKLDVVNSQIATSINFQIKTYVK